MCQGKSLSLAFLAATQGRDLGIWEKQLLWLQPSRGFVPSPPAGSTGHSPGDAEARRLPSFCHPVRTGGEAQAREAACQGA